MIIKIRTVLILSFIFFITTAHKAYALKKEKKQGLLRTILKASGIYFRNKPGKTFTCCALEFDNPQEVKNQKKLFGRPLNVEIIKPLDVQEINSDRITLYLHGWGDQKNSAKLFKEYFSVLPGTIITFNFPDAHGLFSIMRYSNFGQDLDVLCALYVLNQIDERFKPKAVDIFGISRGGATSINLITVLNDETKKYAQDLAKIGINDTKRKHLLKLIQNGSIILDCPLLNMNTVIEFNSLARKANKIGLLAIATKYNKKGLQALHSASTLKNLKLNMLIHFQHNDTIVTNYHEAEFYKQLAIINPETTYLLMGDDGGHIHTHKTLKEVTHWFRKKHGGAYNPILAKEEALLLIAQPTNPEEFILKFHQECAVKERVSRFQEFRNIALQSGSSSSSR